MPSYYFFHTIIDKNQFMIFIFAHFIDNFIDLQLHPHRGLNLNISTKKIVNNNNIII